MCVQRGTEASNTKPPKKQTDKTHRKMVPTGTLRNKCTHNLVNKGRVKPIRVCHTVTAEEKGQAGHGETGARQDKHHRVKQGRQTRISKT